MTERIPGLGIAVGILLASAARQRTTESTGKFRSKYQRHLRQPKLRRASELLPCEMGHPDRDGRHVCGGQFDSCHLCE